MAKAKRLPSGSWRCRPSFTDEYGVKHVESFTAPTKREAERLALAWQTGLLERRKDPLSKPLSEAIDAYIDSCRCAGHSPATLRAYCSARNKAYSMLLEMNVNRITIRELQSWVNARSKQVSPKTLKNNVGLLHAVLKAEGVKVDFDALKTPKMRRVEMAIPSDAQITALLNDAADDNDMYIAIALASLMGLRRSEICALRWSDVHVQGDVAYLDICKALVSDEDGHLVEKPPKTNSGYRFLPIPSALYTELKQRRTLKPYMVSISPNAITERYIRIAKRLGLPTRFHNLRHYHASVMLREGVPEKYIIADMGHSSFEMVRRVYGHVMQEKRASIHAAMDAHSSNILGIDTQLSRKASKK